MRLSQPSLVSLRNTFRSLAHDRSNSPWSRRWYQRESKKYARRLVLLKKASEV